ncbi:phage adaptor protein [Kushneria aurantia]|uniref:Uncharacterized protein n=1 Tax=Kushneria aurantia TaxID=504092 RepID=A0ABV6G4I7_9GAMM|nr:hypothetical protein [Kushneria aurantia]
MTYLELCQRLRQEVGAAGTGPANVNGQSGEYARLIGWVDQAWREIQAARTEWRFAWAEGAVELTPEFRDYSVPDDMARWLPETLRIGTDSVHALEYAESRERFRTPGGSAPWLATLLPDGRIRLDSFPREVSLLTFEYYRTPQVLTANSDAPRLPERFHLLIVYRAMIQYGLYENAPEVVQQGARNSQQMMMDMESSELPPLALAGALA